MLWGSTFWDRADGSRAEQEEKLGYIAVPIKASAEPRGNAMAEESFGVVSR